MKSWIHEKKTSIERERESRKREIMILKMEKKRRINKRNHCGASLFLHLALVPFGGAQYAPQITKYQ